MPGLYGVRGFDGAIFQAGAAAIAFGLVDHVPIGALGDGLIGAFGFACAAVNASIGVNYEFGHFGFPLQQDDCELIYDLPRSITYQGRLSQS